MAMIRLRLDCFVWFEYDVECLDGVELHSANFAAEGYTTVVAPAPVLRFSLRKVSLHSKIELIFECSRLDGPERNPM